MLFIDYKMSSFDSAGTKSYTYDDAFRITGTTDTGTGAAAWTYGYDSLDRITSASKSGTSYGWTYDANGNRLSQTGTGATTFTISGSSNQITSTTGALARTYSYDSAGNTTGYTAATATYNNRGRMKSLTVSSVTANYVYNALGQMAKQSGGTPGTVLYMYDEAGHLVGEYTSAGALVQETAWLDDIPVATLRPHSGGGIDIYYVHADNLNTPIRVTRPSDNKLMWTWYRSPFGTDLPNENPASGGTFHYNLRLSGQRYDSHAGLNQNLLGDYDSASGRYVEPDPIGLGGRSASIYAYASGNPISNIDPLGLFDWPSLPQGVVNGVTGFGDGAYQAITLGFGNLQDIRDVAGINGGVDSCSSAYKFGHVAGEIDGAGALAGSLAAKSFSRGGWLNSNRYLRIGWGKDKGYEVFRISGDWIGDHIDLFRGSRL